MWFVPTFPVPGKSKTPEGVTQEWVADTFLLLVIRVRLNRQEEESLLNGL